MLFLNRHMLFFNRRKAAVIYMVFLGLVITLRPLYSVLARQASHSCHLVLSKGQGSGGAGTSKGPRLHRQSGEDTWGRVAMVFSYPL